MKNILNFEDLEAIMIESLQDFEKITLPYKMRRYTFNMNTYSNIRCIIRHFAYHLNNKIIEKNYEENNK